MARGKRRRVQRVTKEEEAARLALEQRQREIELIQRAHELGLGFKEQELPKDYVDESSVKRTNMASVLALIPFTKEWKEASVAEDEFDNLPKIQLEKEKARALLEMVRIGQQDRALDIMLQETDNDYFYFNKLRTKLEGEGKYSYETPPVLKSRKERSMHNRFAKAIGSNHDELRYA